MKRPNIVNRIKVEADKIRPKVLTILYGSEARGDARPDSDIDLLMLVDSDKRLSYNEKERIMSPFYDIELDTGVLVSMLIMTKQEWENRTLVTPFQINVDREGILL